MARRYIAKMEEVFEVPAKFRLKELLDEVGMTRYELARRSGISYPTVTGIYHNTTAQVALKTLDALSKILKCEPGELIKKTK